MTDLNTGSTGSGASTGSQAETPSPKDMLKETKQAAQDQVQGLTSKVQETAKDKVNKGQETASRTLGDFADAVRKAGDELSSKDQSTVGQVVKQAADSLESLSRTLSDKRPEELLDAVRDFGRRNPVAFIGGAVLVGLAVGRFAKSSASRPASSDESSSSTGYRTSGASYDEPRPFGDQTQTGGTDSFYETAGPGVTTPQGSGTGLDATTSPFDTPASSTPGASTTTDNANRSSLNDGLSGGVQGGQL